MATTRQVFISHDTEDAAFAHRLAQDLHGAGGEVWIAPDNIQPGESWIDAIERGLSHSTDMVVLLTPAALESQWVRKETEIGIMRERRGQMRLIPLMVQRCEAPLLLSSYQMVSFRQDYDAGLRKLVRLLGLQQPQAHVRSARPLAPVSTRPSPSRAAIQERFIDLLAELFDADALSTDKSTHLIDDLELDEIDVIELVMALEEEWNLAIPDEDIKQRKRYLLRTVDDWVTYLTQRLRVEGN